MTSAVGKPVPFQFLIIPRYTGFIFNQRIIMDAGSHRAVMQSQVLIVIPGIDVPVIRGISVFDAAPFARLLAVAEAVG